MSTLKDHLNNNYLTEDEDIDSGAGTGRTPYIPSERLARLRARKEELLELEHELGRKPTQDEIDLIMGDLDSTDPTAPRTLSGDYGRFNSLDVEDDGFDTRRPERGPTARRFND